MKAKLLVVLGSILLAGNTMAGGFQTNLQGQRQIGMGHTGTGLAMDAASVFFNPGAMSHILQNGAQLGLNGIISQTTFRHSITDATARTNNPLALPFSAYGVWGPKEDYYHSSCRGGSKTIRHDLIVKFGLGIYTPYTSRNRWGNHWEGEATDFRLHTTFLQPTISLNLHDKIGIGMGFVYALGGLHLQRSIPVSGPFPASGQLELNGRGQGAGFNTGIYYRPGRKFSAGLAYRSRVNLKIKDGDATFRVPSNQTSQFPNTSFSSTLYLPANTTLGLGFKPNRGFTLAMDAQYIHWESYKKLRFDYDTEINGTRFTEQPRNYRNTFIYRIGIEKHKFEPESPISKKYSLRAGAFFDTSPVPEGYVTPDMPDANAIGLTCGYTYYFHRFLQIDGSFQFVRKNPRTDLADKAGSIPGTYQSNAFSAGLSLSYKFKVFKGSYVNRYEAY